MRSEIASQTKMEFSVNSMDDSIKSMEGDAVSSKLRSMGIKPL
jgi:hypothetical protein